jgi:hypothetical protein
MKSAKTSWHSFGRDIRRDWQDWSFAERLAIKALGISSLLLAAFYFGLGGIA